MGGDGLGEGLPPRFREAATAQPGGDLAVANGPHGLEPGAVSLAKQPFHFFDPSPGDHRAHPLADAAVQFRPFERRAHREGAGGGLGEGLGAAVGAERHPRHAVHLQSPGDARRVVGVNLRGGYRVHPGQLGMAGRKTLLLQPGLHRVPHPGGHLGNFRHAEQQGPEVEPGSPAEDRNPPPLHHAGNGGPGIGDVSAGRILLRRVGHVDQVVGHPAPFGLGKFARADVKSPVNLHRIGVDHLAPQPFGQRHRQGRFSAGGGSHHGHQGGKRRVVHCAPPGKNAGFFRRVPAPAVSAPRCARLDRARERADRIRGQG